MFAKNKYNKIEKDKYKYISSLNMKLLRLYQWNPILGFINIKNRWKKNGRNKEKINIYNIYTYKECSKIHARFEFCTICAVKWANEKKRQLIV